MISVCFISVLYYTFFFYIIVNHVMLSYFFCKQCEIINLKIWTWNFTVILGLSSFSMCSINYIWVWHMSGKDQERSHGILFWVMESWHVWKRSRKTDVCSNQDISHLTDWFFFFTDNIGNCFSYSWWGITLFMYSKSHE